MTLKVPLAARALAIGIIGFSLTAAGQFPVAAITAGLVAVQPSSSDDELSTSLVYTTLDPPSVDAPAFDVAEASPRPARLATLVAQTIDSGGQVSGADGECLARAVYFESRGEPLEGQLAVAQVILNRVASGRFASSICGVINQRGQFSFNPARAPGESRDWRTAKAVAAIAIDDRWNSVTPKATAFHATRVNASWTNLRRIGTIGNHVFYR